MKEWQLYSMGTCDPGSSSLILLCPLGCWFNLHSSNYKCPLDPSAFHGRKEEPAVGELLAVQGMNKCFIS